MGRIKNFLAVLAITLAFVSMWGCGDDVVEFRWEDSRRNAKIIGFVNDSLVMVGDYRFWHKSTERWNGEYYEDSDAGNPRLCVYNYRVQEDGPRWCDSLSEVEPSLWLGAQLTDSIVCGGNLNSYFTLWKIGEKPRKMDLKIEFDGCNKKIGVNRMHEWLDGKFIALGTVSVNGKNLDNALRASEYGSEYCQYAVLDTVAKSITYKHLNEKQEWIKRCDDVRAWGDDVYCLVLNKENGNSFVMKNGTDSIIAPMEKIYDGRFCGNMIELGVRICSLEKDKITCSDVKWTGNEELKFYRNDGSVIDLK